MLFSTVLFVLAQAANGLGNEAIQPTKAPPASKRECLAVMVSPQHETPGLPPGHFSANAAMDLDFVVFLAQPAIGPRILRLQLFTPNGYVYQVLTVPFASGPPPVPENDSNTGTAKPSSVPQRRVSGFPRPLDEQTTGLASYQGVVRPNVKTTLPVAGTLITASSLYGLWRVVPYLDGLSMPCGSPVTFTLDP